MRKKILLLVFISFIVSCRGHVGSFVCPQQSKISKSLGLSSSQGFDVVYLIDDGTLNYRSNGMYTFMYHGRLKILKDRAKKRYTTMNFGYDSQLDSIKLVYLKVIDENGRTFYAKKSDIKETSVYSSNIFDPTRRQIVVILPKLKKNCIVDYLLVYRSKKTLFPGVFGWIWNFQGDEFQKVSRLTVVGPKSSPLRWKIYNGVDNIQVKFLKEEKKGRIKYQFIAENVPKIVYEPAMVPTEEILAKVLLSNTTWKELSKKEYQMVKDSFTTSFDMISKVKELSKKGDPLREIFYFVEKEIRYVGLPFGEKSGFIPYPADLTFRRRYGVCRDKAVLLAQMLRIAGYKAYVALTNPDFKVEKDICVDQFNHMIVAVRKGKNWIFMDPTPGISKEFLPAYEEGKAALIARKEGSDLIYIKRSTPYKNRVEMRFLSEVDQKSLRSHLNLKFFGFYDFIMRLRLKNLKEEEKREFLQQKLKKISKKAMLISYKITPSDLSDLKKDLVIEIDFKIDNPFLKFGKIFGLRFLSQRPSFDFLSDRLERIGGVEDRKYPVDLYTGFSAYVEEKIFIKGKKIIQLPKSFVFSSPFIEYVSNYSKNSDKDGLTLLRKEWLVCKKAEIEKASFPTFLKFLKKRFYEKSSYILFKDI